MGKQRNKKRAGNKAKPPNNNDHWLRVVHWNANGILRDTKLKLLAEVLVSEQIYICFIDETHLTHGSNDDLSCLKNFTVYSKERAFGSKRGGGKMTNLRSDLNHTRWDPELVMYPYLDAE